ncbi:unnamed protein product [Owenia fusiformis]|uniref:Uncharacterized protein n=1 Tax=Owenia fusiformis TaxID=6347 RepID=A0A8S4NY14_OWEFU|nr:unnamed protein product [Owenia fusiformis]
MMGKLTCACLNIKIHIKQAESQPLDLNNFDADAHLKAHDFFKEDVCQAILDLAGITQEHGFLVKTEECGDWRVSSCSNCDMFTHAVQARVRSGIVLVNNALKSDPAIIERLMTSSDYSPLYKIVLQKRTEEDTQPIRSIPLSDSRYESLQHSLTTIQHVLNTYLIQEETAMEDRIRHFEEEQRAVYNTLKSRAKQEKNTMARLALANQDITIQTTLSHAMSDLMSPANDRFGVKSPEKDSNQSSPNTGSFKGSISSPAFPGRLANYGARSHEATSFLANKPTASPDADAVFALEGFEDEIYAFDGSDDNDTDDNSSLTDSYSDEPRVNQPGHVNFSTSVPISVPTDWAMLRKARNSTTEYPDEEVPEDMAASIKAMARSVHESSTEMFGDLPKRHIRTRDIVRSFKQ